jgi:hypothetical protein
MEEGLLPEYFNKRSFCGSKVDHYEDVKAKKKKRILSVPHNYTQEFYLDE